MSNKQTHDTGDLKRRALDRQLALLLRGFSYDGRRAAVVTRLTSAVETGSARPELVLPEPGQTVDIEYRRAAAELWLDYRSEHGTTPRSVVVKDKPDDRRFTIEHGALPARSQYTAEATEATKAAAGKGTRSTESAAPGGISAARSDLMAARVAVVTGGAQGFGLEIARELAMGGAAIVLADRNLDAAEQAAHTLEKLPHGGPAVAVGCDVADEESVARMIGSVVDAFGGFDLFISNAGVLRAGSVLDLSAEDFRLVTAVNYEAFFLCTKHAAGALQAQDGAYRALNSARKRRGVEQGPVLPTHFTTDIIQINSKSGLRGSNRNGAYAGSKFGAIGLVQSFALELVEHGIKVNAVCPGNFFDGPLWSDPENGLFVQYLNAGKVPGAETVAEVKQHYESRVPMQRGCTGADVARAVYYLVEQEYETGQALPVTGGQEMLR